MRELVDFDNIMDESNPEYESFMAKIHECYNKVQEKWLEEQRIKNEELKRKKFEEMRKKHYIPPNECDEEEYRPVVGYPKYEVSDYGNIRNAKTRMNLKPVLNRKGYETVHLMYDFLDGKSRGITKVLHRLVAKAFLDCDNFDELEVNHIDGNKRNNCVSNLEMVTRSQNMQHAWDNHLDHVTEEGISRRRDDRREAFKKKFRPIRCLENGKVYPDGISAEKDLGINKNYIRAATRGKVKVCKGYHFELADWSEINVDE